MALESQQPNVTYLFAVFLAFTFNTEMVFCFKKIMIFPKTEKPFVFGKSPTKKDNMYIALTFLLCLYATFVSSLSTNLIS